MAKKVYMENRYAPAVEAYLSNLKADGMTAATIENARNVTGMYKAFSDAAELPPDSIEAVAAWKRSLSEKGDRTSTIRQYMVVLGAFFKFAVAMKVYEENPVVSALKPKRAALTDGYENLLTVPEIDALLTATEVPGMIAPTQARNRAIITLFLTSGVRNLELISLTPADLRPETNTIELTVTKGGRRRTVSYCHKAQSAMREYLNSGLRPSGLNSEQPLFGSVGTDGQWHGFSRQGVSMMVETYVRQVTGRSGVRSHALRHAYASYCLSNGVSMETLKEVLGHSDFATTERYAEQLVKSAPAMNAGAVFDRPMEVKEA